jgi:hypothetical protein
MCFFYVCLCSCSAYAKQILNVSLLPSKGVNGTYWVCDCFCVCSCLCFLFSFTTLYTHVHQQLKSLLRCHSNIGVWEIQCTGQGAYPRFRVSPSIIDFGVCALGHAYTRKYERMLTFWVLKSNSVRVCWFESLITYNFITIGTVAILNTRDVPVRWSVLATASAAGLTIRTQTHLYPH